MPSAKREVADRRADPQLPIDACGFRVDDDELAAAGVGGRDVQPLTGGVDRDGIDTDAGAGGDVDGADTLGGGVDDGDVDVVATVPACVDALAVRADGQGGDAERQRVRRDDGPGVRVDHRDAVVARRRGADEGTVIRHDGRKRLARDRDGVLDHKCVGVEEGNAVVAVVGDDDGRRRRRCRQSGHDRPRWCLPGRHPGPHAPRYSHETQ